MVYWLQRGPQTVQDGPDDWMLRTWAASQLHFEVKLWDKGAR